MSYVFVFCYVYVSCIQPLALFSMEYHIVSDIYDVNLEGNIISMYNVYVNTLVVVLRVVL